MAFTPSIDGDFVKTKADLSGFEITQEALENLKNKPIHELLLLQSPIPSREMISVLFSFLRETPEIQSLNLGGNLWVDDPVLSQIPETIVSLSLAACPQVTSQGLAALEKTNVRSLELFGCDHLEDEALAQLPMCYETLNLTMCLGLNEKTCQRLSQMVLLRHLTLTGVTITKEQLASFPKQLLTLDLSGCNAGQIDDSYLKMISQMTDLQVLSLSDSQVSDMGVMSLPESLMSLSLNRCNKIRDVAVFALSRRKALRYIGVHGCGKITEDVVDLVTSKTVEVGWDKPQPSHLAMQL